MAERLFRNELARHIGSDVEIYSSSGVFEGLLKNIKKDVVTVVVMIEDGSNINYDVNLKTIDFVRLL